MKITKIKALCKEGKAVQILETGDVRQWIGTKDAIYPADGLTITHESLPSLFDMPDVNKVLEVSCDDLCASDLNPIVRFEEWPQMGSGMPVVYLGKTLIPLGEGGEALPRPRGHGQGGGEHGGLSHLPQGGEREGRAADCDRRWYALHGHHSPAAQEHGAGRAAVHGQICADAA